jgi:apoptosis-inducing factor 3
VDGSFYATSTLCPHYKAPLSKGSLSLDGRVMCPWHGACFDVKTGDIEDGPSVDGLASYAVTVKGGRVYIEADEEGI